MPLAIDVVAEGLEGVAGELSGVERCGGQAA
jgi:hypothetical protein